VGCRGIGVYSEFNVREIARVDEAKDRRQAFRGLKKMGDRYLGGGHVNPSQKEDINDSCREGQAP
jgi:hypothetical protein